MITSGLLQIVIGGGVLIVSGGALLKFWAWTRVHIIAMNARIAVLETQTAQMQLRCKEHTEAFPVLFKQMASIKEDINETHLKVIERLTRVETKIDANGRSSGAQT